MKQVIALALGAGALVAVASAIYADGGAAHRVEQARPISLGTSGGNVQDRSSSFCCSGTLGSLVRNGAGTQFILSNNHVLALSNNGSAGDDIIQPGMIDQSPVCAAPAEDRVADLSAFITIVKSRTANNQADAAVAQVVSGTVRTDGDILDIGCLTGSRAAQVGDSVMKSGRTSGFTTGTVQSTTSTILVSYPNKCGSLSGKAARFVNQIRVTPGSFLQGGDSGSLMVENVSDGRKDATGLLFAGSSSDAFANPIGYVLQNMPGGPYSMVTCSGFTGEAAPVPEDWDPQQIDAIVLQQMVTDSLMEIQGVLGTGVTRLPDGTWALEVYLLRHRPRHDKNIPVSYGDIPVILLETGRIEAF